MDEWGPWIEHDGKHLPPHGSICRATFDDCKTLTGIVDHADQSHRDAFLWLLPEDEAAHVICYRIRKPRGQTDPCPSEVRVAFFGVGSALNAGADGVLGTADDYRTSDR